MRSSKYNNNITKKIQIQIQITKKKRVQITKKKNKKNNNNAPHLVLRETFLAERLHASLASEQQPSRRCRGPRAPHAAMLTAHKRHGVCILHPGGFQAVYVERSRAVAVVVMAPTMTEAQIRETGEEIGSACCICMVWYGIVAYCIVWYCIALYCICTRYCVLLYYNVCRHFQLIPPSQQIHANGLSQEAWTKSKTSLVTSWPLPSHLGHQRQRQQ